MSDISLPEFLQQIGIEHTVSREELATNFMPAAITGLSDGDLVTLHAPYTGREAELYGELHFSQGRVAQAVARAALKNGMNPGVVYEFQQFAAEYFIAARDSPVFAAYSNESSVRIYPETVTIDNNPIALDRPPELVIEYGTCLTGESYLADQTQFLARQKQPFTYMPITRLHFTNQVLHRTHVRYGGEFAEALIGSRLYIGREDGVAVATDEIIATQQAHQFPTEIADILLCVGAQHTSEQDLRQGMANSYALLRQAGMVIIRSLARPASGEIGTKQIADWAYEAGFEERHTIDYDADISGIGNLIAGGHFGKREIKTLVLKK